MQRYTLRNDRWTKDQGLSAGLMRYRALATATIRLANTFPAAVAVVCVLFWSTEDSASMAYPREILHVRDASGTFRGVLLRPERAASVGMEASFYCPEMACGARGRRRALALLLVVFSGKFREFAAIANDVAQIGSFRAFRRLHRPCCERGGQHRFPGVDLEAVLEKPAARIVRAAPDLSPSTTATSCRPFRVALATTL